MACLGTSASQPSYADHHPTLPEDVPWKNPLTPTVINSAVIMASLLPLQLADPGGHVDDIGEKRLCKRGFLVGYLDLFISYAGNTLFFKKIN